MATNKTGAFERQQPEPEPDDVGEAVCDLIAFAWIDETRREPFGDAKSLFDLAQRQHAAVRRQL